MSPIIAPSILAADFANIQREVEMLISFGIPVTEAIHRYAKKPLDVHLMIVNPDNYLEAFRKAGAEVISVHYEACDHLHRSLQAIANLGAKAGVAINPHTPVELLTDVIQDIDQVYS